MMMHELANPKAEYQSYKECKRILQQKLNDPDCPEATGKYMISISISTAYTLMLCQSVTKRISSEANL
jgi:hypothetical protein